MSAVPACSGMLGIDGEYIEAASSSGGAKAHTGGKSSSGVDADTSTGGTAGAGGTAGTAGGGTAGTGGTAGDGGAASSGCGGSPDACGSGLKCCRGACVAPAPVVGCSLDACDPCPAPPNEGIDVCNGTTCAVECNPGFVQVSGQCVAQQDGGSPPGSGGATGTPACKASACPGCVPIGPFGCCKNNGTCGCTWAPGAICY